MNSANQGIRFCQKYKCQHNNKIELAARLHNSISEPKFVICLHFDRYYYIIYIVFICFASFICYKYDIFEVVSNLHVQISKFGAQKWKKFARNL